jgi:hypothetical protein
VRALAQTSKKGKKGVRASDSDLEEVSESECAEYAYKVRTDDMLLGTRVRINEDDWEEPSLYGKTAGDLDTRRHKRHDRCSQEHDMPDLIDSPDDEDEGPYQKCMPNLIYSDDEIYVGAPTNAMMRIRQGSVSTPGEPTSRRPIGTYRRRHTRSSLECR